MDTDSAPFTPSLCQCSVLRVFKVKATQIRGKSNQTLGSPRLELGNSRTEGSAFADSVTRLHVDVLIFVPA